MNIKITQKTLSTLNPGNKPYEVRDTEIKGLLIRVQPSGSMSWYVEWGRGKRHLIGKANLVTAQQAREQAKQVLADAVVGNDPSEKRRRREEPCLGEFISGHYAPWVRQHRKRGNDTVVRIEKVFGELFSLKLGKISRHGIDRWRSERLESGYKETTVNRDVALLRASLSKAVEWEFIRDHPLQGLKKLKEVNNRVLRYLTADEEARLRAALTDRDEKLIERRKSFNQWRTVRHLSPLPEREAGAFGDHLTPMVLLSLNTGIRRGELFQLKWADVNFGRKMMSVAAETSKSGKDRHIPLNAEAIRMLMQWREQQEDCSGLVFPGKEGLPFDNVRKSWTAVRSAASLSDFRWHDLRHSFASSLVMNSVDLNTVRELLGHANYETTLIYAHLAPEHKAKAVAVLDARSGA